jgi:hypothetical protein
LSIIPVTLACNRGDYDQVRKLSGVDRKQHLSSG